MKVTALFVLVFLSAPLGLSAQASDSAAVAGVIATFHNALQRGDTVAAMAQLADDVLVLESGGLETRADYREHHLPADMTFAGAVPSVRTAVRITVRGDVAWAVSTSRTSGTYRDREINSAGAELMVLTRQSGAWKISAIHWSSRTARSP